MQWSSLYIQQLANFYFKSLKLAYFLFSDWIAVQRDAEIPWDPEETPLQIKTDSTLGGNDAIMVDMFDKNGENIGYISVRLRKHPLKYFIRYCTDFKDMSVQPPAKVIRVWKITKTETALIINCNGVEMLNYRFADSSQSSCDTRWGGDVVEKIKFSQDDEASDFYRAGM